MSYSVSTDKTRPFSKDKPDTWPVYKGDDLGVSYRPEHTFFRIWSPLADNITLHLYDQGQYGRRIVTADMARDVDGTWVYSLEGDWKDHYYTFQALINENWSREVPDPYAKAVGVNGNRGMIVDLASTDPEGWDEVEPPRLNSPADMVIWEVHMRDFSIHESSGMKHRGQYLAFTETGTRSPEGLPTGIDHLKELGITHVHLLPVFDFYTIDETRPHEPQYNWGYDPKNYNVPQGSYATDPFNGNVRIREFKEMVKALHQAGIRVVMDVVYNHMYYAGGSPFEQLAPGYFFRMNPDGSFSNGSGCGNETASERPMMRKFMVESLVYWAEEYRIDGFRFDLMGLHDIETMNQIRTSLDEVNPGIILYGEGWTAAHTPLPPKKRAVKVNAPRLKGIAVFSDDIRDGIRGQHAPGFMCGKPGQKESIRFGVVASTDHRQIHYKAVNHSHAPYADTPLKTITYVTCHDDPCLWDKIVTTCSDCSRQDKLDIQKLANAIVLTAQGIPFLHAGEEIVRTKFGEHNTYNLPDSINQLVWSNKAEYSHVFTFYRDLIALRRGHPAFRMPTSKMIRKHLRFLDVRHELVVGFHLKEHANGDPWKNIIVFYNADAGEVKVSLPDGNFRVVATKFGINPIGVDTPGLEGVFSGSIKIPSRSLMVLTDEESI